MKVIAHTTHVGNSAYTAPQCVIVEVCSEGVLSTSILTGGGITDDIDGDPTPII